MNSNPHDPTATASASSPAEETLRLLAKLPAPAGLEKRVQSALDAAPRRGRVLAWPRHLRPDRGWMRSAAAAAIVFVVAGGGWGVYTRVENTHFDQNQPAKVIVMPARMPGGFGGAGAIRTPQMLPGPKAPVKVNPAAKTTRPKAAKKPAAVEKPANGGASQPDKAAAEAGAPR